MICNLKAIYLINWIFYRLLTHHYSFILFSFERLALLNILIIYQLHFNILITVHQSKCHLLQIRNVRLVGCVCACGGAPEVNPYSSCHTYLLCLSLINPTLPSVIVWINKVTSLSLELWSCLPLKVLSVHSKHCLFKNFSSRNKDSYMWGNNAVSSTKRSVIELKTAQWHHSLHFTLMATQPGSVGFVLNAAQSQTIIQYEMK